MAAVNYNIIATGSTGNATVIEDIILVDCGVPFNRLTACYKKLKLVLLTHEHTDHFNRATIRKLAAERPTLRFACGKWLLPKLVDAGVSKFQIDILTCGMTYSYGLCKVTPFFVEHDVPNCGWKVILRSGQSVVYCTDMVSLYGVSAKNYDLYLLEGNYDENEIAQKIADKRANGEFIYEKRVLRTHMSRQRLNDWLIENMGPHSSFVYMHCHIDKEGENNGES